MKKTLRVTLDIEVEDLTDEELDEACEGVDCSDEDCGDLPIVTEMSAFDVADVMSDGLQTCTDLWAGSNMYGKISDTDIKIIDTYWVD